MDLLRREGDGARDARPKRLSLVPRHESDLVPGVARAADRPRVAAREPRGRFEVVATGPAPVGPPQPDAQAVAAAEAEHRRGQLRHAHVARGTSPRGVRSALLYLGKDCECLGARCLLPVTTTCRASAVDAVVQRRAAPTVHRALDDVARPRPRAKHSASRATGRGAGARRVPRGAPSEGPAGSTARAPTTTCSAPSGPRRWPRPPPRPRPRPTRPVLSGTRSPGCPSRPPPSCVEINLCTVCSPTPSTRGCLHSYVYSMASHCLVSTRPPTPPRRTGPCRPARAPTAAAGAASRATRRQRRPATRRSASRGNTK